MRRTIRSRKSIGVLVKASFALLVMMFTYIPNSSDETTIKGLVEQLESSIMTKDIMYVQKEVKKLNNLLSGQNKVLSEDDAIRLQNTLDKAYFLKKENSEVATEYFISVRSWIA